MGVSLEKWSRLKMHICRARVQNVSQRIVNEGLRNEQKYQTPCNYWSFTSTRVKRLQQYLQEISGEPKKAKT